MSHRAAYNFLSSISLGGSQSNKKDAQGTVPHAQQSQSQPQPEEKHHHRHRDHFKAKLASTLEKKHSLIHKHDKDKDKDKHTNPPPTISSIPLTNSTSSTLSTSNKPAVHPNSIKRSTSNITVPNEYAPNNISVVRSVSGTAIPNREPSPRDAKTSPRDSLPSDNHGNLHKTRHSVDQGTSKPRDNGDYGIVSRKASDPGPTAAPTKSRTINTDQGTAAPPALSRGNSELSAKEARRPSDAGYKHSSTDKARSESAHPSLLPSASVTSKEHYRKLSKSANDASSRAQATNPLSNSQSFRSVSTSQLPLRSSSKSKRGKNSERALDQSKEQAKKPESPLRSPHNENTESPPIEVIKLKRHRRKRSTSKSKKVGMRKEASVKHNPAALDFLKGISLGENTPTLRKRKSVGKSKLATAVYPQKYDTIRPPDDTILYAGSASTKKIKISEYSSQPVPGRVYLSTRSSSTFGVFSLIKFDAKANKKDKDKNTLKDSYVSVATGKLKGSTANTPLTTIPETQEPETEQEYDPHYLDDPNLTTGKHRTVMNLACFKESIIPYVRPGVIKDELNELFRQKHPWVPSGVTLHKIRKLKKALVPIAVAGGLEVSTVAIAYVLFERLIMKGVVTKPQIRLYGAVCLLLAAKSNDPNAKELKTTVEAIEKNLEVERKELWEHEFPVFAAFNCCLLLPPDHVIPHIHLIIKYNQDLVGNPY